MEEKTQTEKIQLNLEKLNSTQLPISVRHGLDGPTSEEGREARPVSQKALHGTCVRGKRGWVEANSGCKLIKHMSINRLDPFEVISFRLKSVFFLSSPYIYIYI